MLRFDPGGKEGMYVVKQAEAKIFNTGTSHKKLQNLCFD